MLIFKKCNFTELLLFLMFLFLVTGYFFRVENKEKVMISI
jgi:hypothetical protein